MLFFLIFNLFNETIYYDLYLGFIKVGSLKLESKKIIYQEKEVYQLSSYLNSNKNLSPFVEIADTLISYTDFDFKTLFAYKSINEKNFKERCSLYFDYKNNKIIYSDNTIFPLINEIKDILTFWFYTRKIIAENKMAKNCFLHYNKKNYEVVLEKKRRLFITTNIGSFYAWEIYPQTKPKAKILGSIYIQEEKDYLPLIIKTNFFGGFLKAVIRDYER
ncbi:MAG: DUF3108 domain-containing protein [candidate division WOR-3 bacterium]